MTTSQVLAIVKLCGGSCNLASLVEVRREMAAKGLGDRTKQDKAIYEARKANLVVGANLEGRDGISQEEAAACIRERDSRIGYLSAR